MAFNFSSPKTPATAPATATAGNDSWKATAFLNLWVKRADGSRAKIGAISLKDSKNFDRALIARLQQEGAIEALMQHLELDFQMAASEGSEANVGF